MWTVVDFVMNHRDMHEVILSNLEPVFQEHQAELGVLSVESKLRLLFENYRSTPAQSQGLRLTYRGNDFLTRIFTHWRYHHETYITNGVLLELDKTMTWPYYVSRTIMVFYSEVDAAMFRLSGHKLNSIQ
jgi:hypothetical protein